MKISINAMTGQMPALEPHLLENGQAQEAENCRFESGGIVPLRAPLFVQTPSGSGLKTIHKVDETWFAFSDVVHLCDAPVFNDANRFFFTGTGTPRKATKAGYAGGTSYAMGVPKPTVPFTINFFTDPAGIGTATQEEVSYVYCYVTAWGEQGPPSDPTAIVTVMDGQYVTLTGVTFPTGYSSTYNIIGYRVFRLNNGTSGAEYQLLYPSVWVESDTTGGHIPVASTTVTDRNGSTLYELIDDGSLGQALSTEDFQPPDADMDGLVLLSNGVLAGFTGNQVALSEPYIPYGWPAAYTVATGRDVVALAGYDTTLVVVTKGEPWTIDCYDPSSPSPYKVGELHPGLNARGVTSGKGFVAYVSTTGLIRIDADDGLVNLTRTSKLFTDRQWAALNPSDMLLIYYDGRYFVYNYNLKTGFILDFNSSLASYVPFELPNKVLDCRATEHGVFLLTKTDAGAFRIEQFDAGASNLTAIFKSKRFRFAPTNFSFAAVRGYFDSATFTLYVKPLKATAGPVMETFYTRTVTGHNAFRLPGGMKYDEAEVLVSTSSRDITEIVLATSMEELRG